MKMLPMFSEQLAEIIYFHLLFILLHFNLS